jgi:hypothetical protein
MSTINAPIQLKKLGPITACSSAIPVVRPELHERQVSEGQLTLVPVD